MNTITFEKGDLSCLRQVANSENTEFSGYYRFIFDGSINGENASSKTWYLYVSKGKIVFSSEQEISLSNILNVLKKYIPALRNPEAQAQEHIDKLILLAAKRDDVSIPKLLLKLTLETKLFKYQQIAEVMEAHLVTELEQYLLTYSGQVEMVNDATVDLKKPVMGFTLKKIIAKSEQRKIGWQEVNKIIPSLDLVVQCNEQNSKWLNLPTAQQKKIQQLVNSGTTLESISYNLGEDPLKVTKTIAKLLQKQLVVLSTQKNIKQISVDSPSQIGQSNSNQSSRPEIAIIDDSVVLLKAFKKVVTNWGYGIRYCNDSLKAVDFLLASPPKIIFLDVNMPNLSGFELIKAIRMESKLSSIPLVVLTGENTVINSYRAKWSKSIFLSKPQKKEDISSFKFKLKDLLDKTISSSV